ncbi:hypothetical protein OAS98_04480 [Candidatus Pelagibacter sp.]|nr:hypothetical protein [Candidatus Pelagibacter sp.]
MKKSNLKPILSKTLPTDFKISEIDKVKTTNINILLNRVNISRKKELKQKIIFSTSLLLCLVSIVFFFSN